MRRAGGTCAALAATSSAMRWYASTLPLAEPVDADTERYMGSSLDALGVLR